MVRPMVAGEFEGLPQLRHIGGDRIDLKQLALSLSGDDGGQSGLARSGRASQENIAHPVFADQLGQEAAIPKQMLLAKNLA